MGDKKVQWTRTKVHESTHLDAGKGIPESVSKSLRLNQLRQLHKYQSARSRLSFDPIGEVSTTRKTEDWGSLRRTVQQKSIIAELSELLELEEYGFPEDDEVIGEPTKFEAKLDVTALDRYNEDVRRIRKLTIDECRQLPLKYLRSHFKLINTLLLQVDCNSCIHKIRGDADENTLGRVKLVVRSLCRTVYYGTHKAQVLAEGAVILIVWLLNRRATPVPFKVNILQSFAEMIWTSAELKSSVCKYTFK
ncbi:unnamed protein product [Orchesella dallaii]|uniref:Uncharacterized protein n=1 Tax=Orchesella dallaii TaxID=48710 RepID=A0ABP1RTM0_9HEXA